MSKTRILTLMALLLSQYDNVRGNPLDNFPVNIESNEDANTVQSNVDRSPRSHHTWMLPISTFSVSNLFKDNGGDATVLKKAMETIQKNQEEMLKLLSQLTEASKAVSCQTPSVPISNNAHSNRESEDLTYDKLKPTIIDILDNKKEIPKGNSNILSGSQNKIIYDNFAATPVDLSKTDNSPIKLDVNENKSEEYNSRDTTEVKFISGLKEKVSERIKEQLIKSENDLKNDFVETPADLSKTDNSPIKLDVNENKSEEYNNKDTTEVKFISGLKEKVSERIKEQLMKSENDPKNDFVETPADLSKTDNSPIKLDVNENKSEEYNNKDTTEVKFISGLKEKVSERIKEQLMKSENDLKNEKESSKSSNFQVSSAEEIDERNVRLANEGSSNYVEKNFKGTPLTYDGDGSDA